MGNMQEYEEDTIQILEGQLIFTPLNYSFLGGTHYGSGEFPFATLVRAGNNQELITRCKTRWAQKKSCYLAFSTYNLPFKDESLMGAVDTLGEIVATPILSIGNKALEDELGLKHLALEIVVNMNNIRSFG